MAFTIRFASSCPLRSPAKRPSIATMRTYPKQETVLRILAAQFRRTTTTGIYRLPYEVTTTVRAGPTSLTKRERSLAGRSSSLAAEPGHSAERAADRSKFKNRAVLTGRNSRGKLLKGFRSDINAQAIMLNTDNRIAAAMYFMNSQTITNVKSYHMSLRPTGPVPVIQTYTKEQCPSIRTQAPSACPLGSTGDYYAVQCILQHFIDLFPRAGSHGSIGQEV